ncbi:MAG: HAD family hydrolase [Chloroflexi bacterium]|nr:HAD family hydrolase [Chloroflexota bacterium]
MSRGAAAARRWVCLDVGETLIEETRAWGAWADDLGIPRLTFFAVLGAIVARGGDQSEVFDAFGVSDWHARRDRVEMAFGGFQPPDLYPDALSCVDRLRADGYGVAVVANQPASRRDELLALGLKADVVAMSEALGVYKPTTAFYERVLELTGAKLARDVAYVGDRIDNDVIPSAAAGMRPVWLRRGPWGHLQSLPPFTGALVVDSLDELIERLDEVWAGA